MRDNRLRALSQRKFVHTTYSGHALPVSDNLFALRFNAVMERFFLILKTERIWQRDYTNHAEAMRDIAG